MLLGPEADGDFSGPEANIISRPLIQSEEKIIITLKYNKKTNFPIIIRLFSHYFDIIIIFSSIVNSS